MSLREQVRKHLPGEHDQLRHGEWAGARTFGSLVPAGFNHEALGGPEGSTWAEGQFAAWRNKLSADELQALRSYRGEGAALVNSVLREQQPYPYSDIGLAAGFEWLKMVLDKMLAEAPPLPEDIVVFRSTWAGVFEGLKVGDTFRDQGYVSTSLDESRVVGRYGGGGSAGRPTRTAVIRIPKGTRVLYISEPNDVNGESEILLPRDTHFRMAGEGGGHPAGTMLNDRPWEHIWLEVVND